MLKPFTSLHALLALGVFIAGVAGGAMFASSQSAPSAKAEDSSFSAAQRAEIGAIVHDYILANPEVIPAAIQVLQERHRADRLASLAGELVPGPASIVAGNKDGDVTLVEFFDFRCPFCRRGYEDVKKLMAEDPNLRVIFNQFPILDRGDSTASYDLARAGAAAARQGKYLAFHDAVFTWPTRVTSAADIDAIAASAGLDIARLKQDMADPIIAQAIDRNRGLGQALDIGGTPAYVVGNRIIEGAVGYDQIAEAIKAARQQAQTANKTQSQ